MTPPSDSEESLLYAKHVYSKYSPRRRYLFVVSSLTGLSLIGLVIFSLWTQQPGWKSNSSSTVPQDSSDVLLEAPGNSALDPLDPLAFVNGPATLDFHGKHIRPFPPSYRLTLFLAIHRQHEAWGEICDFLASRWLE